MEQKDFFDRLMETRLFRPLLPFWQKRREVLLYLLFGGLTTLISILSFWLFYRVFGWNELIDNVFSWILAVLFAYLTNARWVFRDRAAPGGEKLRQLLRFYAGRLATLGVEELLLWGFITRLGWPAMPVKIAAQVAVILLNYIISKLLVFQKEK